MDEQRRKQQIFTVIEVAKILKVAPRTVYKWFDTGRLSGYRVPSTQNHCVHRDSLIKFMKEHGFPLTDVGEEE